MDFVERYERYNNNHLNDKLHDRFVLLQNNNLSSIDCYFTYADLTPDMKKYLYGGLRLLARKKIISQFSCDVFYLQKVEKIGQAEIVDRMNSTPDKIKKAIRNVRDKLLDEHDAIMYAFFGENEAGDEEDEENEENELFEKTDVIMQEKYGEHPAAEARMAPSRYWDQRIKVLIGNDPEKSIQQVRAEIENDPVYKRLNSEAKALENSAAAREWEKKRQEVAGELKAARLGCSIEELKRKEKEEDNYQSAAKEIHKIFLENAEVRFKLWGFMQLYWLKTGKTCHE
jgi:hypothetical protein